MSHRSHPFRSGLVAGFAWPFMVVGGVVAIVYRLTGTVPFPVQRSIEGELAVKLVDPQDVPRYWARWRAELAPLVDRIQEVTQQVRAAHENDWLERK
jgi:hypothetical protein